ncbi:DUF2798 domain-containing protein [Marinomonas agarivorans]|nr:DUF2798 domain-containing protein [Marinomonas agarivorans]
MLPEKYRFYVFSFIMSLLMSGVMSLAFLYLETMNIAIVIQKWPASWFVSMLIALPMSLLVVPLTDRLVTKIIKKV